MTTRTVAIVDPYDAGAMLAPAFAGQGIAAVMVASTPEMAIEEEVRYDPAAFASLLPWNGAVAATIRTLRAHGVEQVIAGSERGVMLADRLGEALGLPGNGTRLSEARRDKFHMIETVGRCGIRVPCQIQSDRLDAILDWMAEGDHWPAVLKPRRAKGSRGVRLCASSAAVARAFDEIHGRPDGLGGYNETVLAQHYLRGREYVVDTVSLDGRHRLAALWAYGKPAPGYEAIGLLSTKTLLPPDGPLADILFAFAVKVLDALEIRHGAGHCELILDRDGPALVEIGARLHGGPPAHLMSRAATGTSQLDLLVQSCRDPADFLDQVSARYTLAGGAAMALLRDRHLGDEIERLPSTQRVVWNAGDPPPPVAGLATLIHPDPGVVAADLEIATGAIACGILDRRESIEAMAPAWRALLERSRCNRAFGGPAWYLAALEADPALSPLVIAASRGGRLAAILPLVRDRDSGAARFATMLSDYNDLIAADGDRAAARRLMIFARARFPRLELACVRADSDAALAEARAPSLSERKFVCPFADLSSGYEAWRATRSPGFRRRLAQALRLAAREGLSAARLDREQDGAAPALFLDLHRARFGARSLFDRDPAARAFVKSALPRLLRDGDAMLFGLRAGERMIGLNLCMRGADSLGYWNAGFLPDFAAFSPGTLMVHAGIREACALGLAEFDFLRGREAYKLRWSTGEREIGRLR